LSFPILHHLVNLLYPTPASLGLLSERVCEVFERSPACPT